MLRKIFGFTFLFFLAIFLAGVWLQNYYFVSDFQPAGTQLLEVWNKPPSRQVKELKLWKEGVLRFEQAYPEIKIKGVEREFSPQEFVSAMAGGKGPDVMHVWIGSLPILARQGFVAPLDKYLENWDQKDYIPKIVWEPARVDGITYGIPRDTYFMVLFYRKDLFFQAGLNPQGPPKTWQELAGFARRLTKPGEGQYGLGLPPQSWNFMDFVWQNGGEVARRLDSGKWEATLASPAVVQAMEYWHDLKWKYRVMPPSDLTGSEDVSQMFALGRVAMMTGVANQLPALIHKYGLDFKNIGIAPLPAGPNGLRASHAGGEVYIINSSIPLSQQAAAWKYIEFELSAPTQLWKWVRMNELGMTIFPGAFSASTSLLNMPEFSMVKEEMNFVRNEPNFPEWLLIKQAMDADPLQSLFIFPELNILDRMRDFNFKINTQLLSRQK